MDAAANSQDAPTIRPCVHESGVKLSILSAMRLATHDSGAYPVSRTSVMSPHCSAGEKTYKEHGGERKDEEDTGLFKENTGLRFGAQGHLDGDLPLAQVEKCRDLRGRAKHTCKRNSPRKRNE